MKKPTEPTTQEALTAADLQEGDLTRSRLLEAGAEVFAEQGFRRATIRDIVARAGANVAAVSYHFGDKQGLYLAALRHWLSFAAAAYPADEGLGEGATPEQRLRAFIRSFLHRLLADGPSAWAGRLMGWEMIDPTDAAGEVLAEVVRPMADRLRSIVRDLIGPAAASDEQTVGFCIFSVVGQCVFYRHAEPMIRRLFPHHKLTTAGIDELAGHITGLCLAGFREYAEGGTP